ncbi:MAG TPA: hypothetical protein VH092_01770, partial [Urbifossiella sp.]|nr:hypothetical protein [Urbifossiella sp.]
MTAAPPAPADTSPPPADPTPADVPSSPVFAPDDAPRREFHPRPAAWRGDAGPPSPIRAFTATLLLASVVAGMAVGLAALPRRPAPVSFVSVPVGEYEDPAWPVNPWANRDAELLAGRFGPSAVTAFGFQERDRFRSLLGWLGGTGTTGLPKPDGRRTVVFHLTALASVRGGTAYLLPADARPDDAGGWVPLADVIRAAADRGVSRTLLLLDIRPAADAVGGPLGDDAVAVVHEALRATPPEFPVLVACGPGEVSLPATPAGSSAFAFYLAEGLGGAADGFGEEGRNRPDGEVTVRELARFTAARVDRWARLVHGRRQTPTLHAPPADRSADFVLFRRPDWRPPDPAPAAGYPAWLRSAWDARDSLRGGDRARRDPVAFARLTAGLLAAEDWWYNAASTTRAEEVWRTARADWERAAARTPLPPDWAKFPAVAARLPVARTGAPEAPPEVAKSFSAFLSAKQEQETEALAAWGAAARPHRAAAIGLVWAQAVDTTAPSAEQADKWGRAAAAVDPTNPLAESRVLTAVAGRGSFRRQRLAAFPSAAVAALFRAEDELARVVALGPVEFVAVTELV